VSTTPESTPGQPEYLESGGGSPVEPGAATPSRGRGRKGLLIGGGVAALALVGAGAWAAVSFFATGPQPAEALPAATLGYVAVDLDPSGGQKIEALRTLNKFPAFEDEVGIGTDDDILEAIFDEIESSLDCSGLDYEDDVEPWLGDRAAVAAVDTGDDQPAPVFVLQVKDADRAADGIAALADCAGEEIGSSIDGDWAVLAETDTIAEQVTDDAAEASLADDEDFQRWTDEAGDSGVVTMYAGPALGDYLADNADELFGFPFGLMGGASVDCMPDEDGSFDACSALNPDAPDARSLVSDEMVEAFEEFDGMAGIVRFDDGSVEMEFAAEAGLAESGVLGAPLVGEGGGETISTLPEDTAFAVGLGFADGWFGDLLDAYGPYLGGGMADVTMDDLIDEMETETGLTIPDDIETLFGDSAALAVSGDFDPEAFFESTDGSDVPIALKIDGDPEEIETVLDKLRSQFPADEVAIFGSDSEGGTIVIGPNADYREQVLRDGELAGNEVFEDVVREVDDAAMVLFVNVNEIEEAIADALGGSDDEEVLENLEPVSGLGVSAWIDDEVSHSVMRVTTD
jgi:hypothetical protein